MSADSKKKRIPQPLFVKLLFIFLGTGILILIAVAGYLMFLSPAEPPHYFLHRGLQKCTASLASEIGSPPNFEHAREIANELGLSIRVQSPNGEIWQSPGFNPEATQPYRIYYKGTVYNFALQQSTQNKNLVRQIIWLIAVLLAILALAFWLIRWVLKPLRQIMEGVEAISQGQLDYQMPFKPGGEFESLASAFNQMTSRVNEMIRAREQLLVDVSHELRSPMARLQVSTEFIEKHDLQASMKEDLREMDGMVEAILRDARLSSPYGQLQREEVKLDSLLKTLTERYATQKPGVVFESEGEHTLNADTDKLRSAIRNLIENALKYSGQQDEPVQVKLQKVDNGISISISDHGIGIPEEEQNLVFEPFYRVDKSRARSTGGFGLGLALCKKIIEAHGGTITLKSELGKGSTFTIWLPQG